MAAGLGFKTFTTGEVLTAADTNGYLMQGVLVFASAAARNAAITSPQEGQFAYTKDTNGLWYYDGAAWVASGATGDIEGVTAGTGISGGGTSGTVTITNSMATEIAAKGDLIVGTGAATFDNLAVGTNGMTIVADSSTATGLKWATASGGGGMTVIASGSLSGSSLSLTSIPQTYNNLQLVLRDWTFSSASTNFKGTVNGATQYSSMCQYGQSTSSTGNSFYQSLGWMQLVEASVIAAQEDPVCVLDVYDYTNTTSYKAFNGLSAVTETAGNTVVTHCRGSSKSTAAVTTLTVTSVGGTFTAGTYTLYGVK